MNYKIRTHTRPAILIVRPAARPYNPIGARCYRERVVSMNAFPRLLLDTCTSFCRWDTTDGLFKSEKRLGAEVCFGGE